MFAQARRPRWWQHVVVASVLSVVHRRDQAATSSRGQRIGGHPYLGYIEREPVLLQSLFELLEEPFRLGCPAAEHDRNRFIDSRKVLRFRKRAAQRFHQ